MARKEGEEETLQRETKRVENTKLADTGHNLISTVRGGGARGGTAVQCNLPWQPIHTSMARLPPPSKTGAAAEPLLRGGRC